MNLYGVVININGLEPSIKLIEEDVYEWVMRPDNPKASIDLVPISVFEKFLEENKHLKLFRNGSNELIKTGDFENTKAEIAPAFKSGFNSLNDAKKFAAEQGYTYASTIIKYIQS